MKLNSVPSFEVEIVLTNLSLALCRGRLLRGETQALAAQRANVSLATYVRMESKNMKQLAGIGVANFFEALCVLGYKDALLSLADPSNDTEGALMLERTIPRRGRALGRLS
jgi:hypothetical protein